MVIRDVVTRWNYTHAMIRRGQLLRAAIDSWTFETPELRALVLTDVDWRLLGDIADILE
ncbi:hypothetical protein K435DRAFT_570433, partial [Dendrothele bispora CBS 962.96]